MSSTIRTEVAIVGAGPAGLTLAHLLHRRGVGFVVVDKFDHAQLVGRSRAGLLEWRTAEVFRRLGVADGLERGGRPNHGCEFRSNGHAFRLDFSKHYEGRSHWVYPQQHVVADLLNDLHERRGRLILGNPVCAVDHDPEQPRVHLEDGTEIIADIVAGADGKHGAVRRSLPESSVREFHMVHEFKWLTLLAETGPSTDTTVYAQHEQGFAGHLLRSEDETRFHLQVPLEDTVEDWPDARIWDQLHIRLATPGFSLKDGRIVSKNMLDMESRVMEPMRVGRVALLGDAAHTITPSGGKGMNLAVADAVGLDRALRRFEISGRVDDLDAYGEDRLPDIWNAQEFSHALLHMMHTYEGDDESSRFRQRLQQARLWRLEHDPAYAATFSRTYIGPLLPADAVPA